MLNNELARDLSRDLEIVIMISSRLFGLQPRLITVSVSLCSDSLRPVFPFHLVFVCFRMRLSRSHSSLSLSL